MGRHTELLKAAKDNNYTKMLELFNNKNAGKGALSLVLVPPLHRASLQWVKLLTHEREWRRYPSGQSLRSCCFATAQWDMCA